jgi:hypothetical protein
MVVLSSGKYAVSSYIRLADRAELSRRLQTAAYALAVLLGNDSVHPTRLVAIGGGAGCARGVASDAGDSERLSDSALPLQGGCPAIQVC